MGNNGGLSVEHNESLGEIEDPVARAKLEGLQEASFGVDHEIIAMRSAVEQQRGAIRQAKVMATLVRAQAGRLATMFEQNPDEMPQDEAKLRADQTNQIANQMDSAVNEAMGDLTALRGQLEGLERAAQAIAGRFTTEATKYERWQRMQDDDDELGRGSEPPADLVDEGASAASPEGEDGKDA